MGRKRIILSLWCKIFFKAKNLDFSLGHGYVDWR